MDFVDNLLNLVPLTGLHIGEVDHHCYTRCGEFCPEREGVRMGRRVVWASFEVIMNSKKEQRAAADI
jgi:hypothetical protein